MKTSLTFVIVNYNTPKLVADCLASIDQFFRSKTQYKTEVIVVDNGSQDDSVQQLKSEFKWVRLIETGKNLGFSGGNNVALKLVKTEYVMLLNSDTELTTESHLDKILDYMETNPQVAVVTPKLLLSNGQLDFASHRGEPTPWASLTYFTGLAKLFPQSQRFAQYHQTYLNLAQTHQIDACSGAAMVVRTSTMKEIGYFDEQFFMYAEDLDWCKRFRDAGYQVVYFPHSTVVHHKYQSGLGHQDKKLSKKTTAHFYDTMLQYYDKHYRQHYPFWVRWGIQLFILLKKGVL